MTNSDLITVRGFMISFLNENKAETPINWRLRNRTLKATDKPMETYNDEMDDFQIDNCVKGDKQEIVIKDGRRQFTAEGEKAVKKYLKDVLLKKEVDIDLVKVDWAKFSDYEKKWFNISDEETHRIMGLFISGLPEYKEVE